MSSKQPPTADKLNLQTSLSLCLSAVQRLKTPDQFQTVYKSKQWGGSKHFTFNVLSQDNLDDNRGHGVLGPTVSKKVSKRAVDRNRIKRQIREYYRLHQHEIKNAHLVITAKPSCRKASDTERYESLDELWVKILKWQRWHQRQLDALKTS
jgi:ribonuclease P protein component